jgi:elongation factor P--(R)-beta-lysine ligase
MSENDRSAGLAAIKTRHRVLKAMRDFFYERGYLEVETPYLLKAAPSEPYIEPLRVRIGGRGPYYLHTSPEIGMKSALASGVERIFQICKVFRVEEFEEHHSVEFTMVEWYRPGTYLETMAETRDLVCAMGEVAGKEGAEYVRYPWKTYELRVLLVELAGFDPLPLSCEALKAVMSSRGYRGLGADATWAELFFRLLVQQVEPRLVEREKGPYFIKDWPAALTAMARQKDEHTAERFELYMNGLEIANGYTELLDPIEQRQRIARDNETRTKLGKEVFPSDEGFLRALAHIPGPVSGVSVGVDRLLMALLGKKRIADILINRFTI